MGRKSKNLRIRELANKNAIKKKIKEVQVKAKTGAVVTQVQAQQAQPEEILLAQEKLINIDAQLAEILAIKTVATEQGIVQDYDTGAAIANSIEAKIAALEEKGLFDGNNHFKENIQMLVRMGWEFPATPTPVFITESEPGPDGGEFTGLFFTDKERGEVLYSEMGNTTTSTCSSDTISQQIKGQIKVLKPEAPFSSEQDYAKYSNSSSSLQLLNQIGHNSKNIPLKYSSADCSTTTTTELEDLHNSSTSYSTIMGSVGGSSSNSSGLGAGSLSSSSRSRESIHYNNSVSLKHKNQSMDIRSNSNTASGSSTASVKYNNIADGGNHNHLIPNSKTPPKYFFNCRDDDKDTEIIYKRGVRVGHNKERYEMDSNSQESSHHSNTHHQLETLNPDYVLYSDRVLNGNIESRTEYDTTKFKSMKGLDSDSQASTSGGILYNNVKDSSDPSSSSPTEGEALHKGTSLYQNLSSSGEKRSQKKSAKNAKEKRTTDINVTEIPGFRGRDNIDSIIEYIDGGNGSGESKRVGRKDTSHRDHRSKSNEKELLVKSVSLDDDSFASPNVRPMSERTTAGGSNREIVKRQKTDHHITALSNSNTKKHNNNNPRTTSPVQIKENSISPTPSTSTTIVSTTSTSTTTKIASQQQQQQISTKEPSRITQQQTSNVSQVSSQVPQKSLMTQHNKKEPKEAAAVVKNNNNSNSVSSTNHPSNSKLSNSSKFAQDDNNKEKDKEFKEALEEKHEFTEFRTVTRKNKFKNKNKDNSPTTNNTSSSASSIGGGSNSNNSSSATLINSHNNNNNNNHHNKDTSSSGGNLSYASGGSNNKGANNNNNPHQTLSSSLVNSNSSPARPASSTSSSPDLAFPPLLVNSVQPPVLNTIQTRDWVNVCVGGESKTKQTPPASSSTTSHPPLPSPASTTTSSSKTPIEEVQTPPLANNIVVNNPNPNSNKSNSVRKSQQQQQQTKSLSDNKNNSNNNNNNVKNNKNSNASGVVFVSNSNDNNSGRESNVNISAHKNQTAGAGDTQEVHHNKSFNNSDNIGAQHQQQQQQQQNPEVDIGPVVFCGENFKEQPAQIPINFGFTFGFNNDVQDILRASGGNSDDVGNIPKKSGGGNPPIQKIKAESDDSSIDNKGWIQLGPGSDINQYYTPPPPPSVGSDQQSSFNPQSCQIFMDKYAADLLESSGQRRKQVIHRI